MDALSIGRDPSTVPPFEATSIFTESAIDPFLLTGLIVAAALYLWGVNRLRQNGVRWSPARTLAFIVGGLGTIGFVTMSGVGAYDETLFSVHMVQHMVLSMVSPVFLALGAPVTLALRALPKRGRSILVSILHSKIVRFYSFPAIGWILFVTSPYLLYMTGWYEASISNIWLHQLLHAHFIAVGCLFFWPLVGVDPVPGRMPHPFRILALTATLPMHAILGLTIMQSTTLFAGDYYTGLRLDWLDVAAQQRIGGGLLWSTGDLVGLLMVGTAMYQWYQASQREAVREDRRLDRLEAQQAAAAGRDAAASTSAGGE